MTLSTLTGYLDDVNKAFQAENARAFSQLLSADNLYARRAVKEAAQNTQGGFNLGALCEKRLPSPLDEVLATHCQCLLALEEKRFIDAYQALGSQLTHYLKIYRAAEKDWVNQPLLVMVADIRTVSANADDEMRRKGKTPDKLRDASTKLTTCFTYSNQAQHGTGKKAASLSIINELFKIYFKLNTLHLCNRLIKAVENPSFQAFEQFPKAQKVTYKYYEGRLSVFGDDHVSAEKQLGYALKHCHRSHTSNKRRILRYLIAIRLLSGKLPSRALLERYNLPEYIQMVEALRYGNIRLLNETLEKHQEELIRSGTYLIVEKLKAAVTRTLFKKIHNIYKTLKPPEKAFQLPLSYLQVGMEWSGEHVDLDEVECILSNLIFRRYVKGYISHKSRVVVLSKVGAFQPLEAALLHDPV